MEISQSSLAYMLLCSSVLGVLFGALYDVVRIVRVIFGMSAKASDHLSDSEIKLPLIDADKLRAKKKGRSRRVCISGLAFMLDFIFCIICACAFLVLEYYTNDGQVRAMSVAGAAAGFAIYYFTLGKLVMLVAERIAFCLRVSFAYICFFVSFPFKKLWESSKGRAKKLKARIDNRRTKKYLDGEAKEITEEV